MSKEQVQALKEEYEKELKRLEFGIENSLKNTYASRECQGMRTIYKLVIKDLEELLK